MTQTLDTMNCKFPNCIFEGSPDFCPRHREKGKPKEKKVYSIPKVSASKKSKLTEEKERKERISKFYDEMLNIAPFNCQECGCNLSESVVINVRSIVCHILEKRNFHSVECNPDNIIFLCNLHHGRLDNNLERAMKEFKIAPLIRERVQLLLPLLPEIEAGKVSKFLL